MRTNVQFIEKKRKIKTSNQQMSDTADYLLKDEEVTTLMDTDQADDEVTVLDHYNQFI